ncbi:hypothetical protein EXE59_20175 [Nocardioides eburneiflavus]|uniref:Uncharacterized protein n=1 Tax=Nocardioides eburneiflavus TaxID=2518372 RepID=A0A4Z1CI42_9ACTN|nr:hypothetical protein [Nocardioides eburneiflavus]TGN66008.1 hypothetical protein EXE59_20175 [Nocardioides eburneiflavus]
MTSEQVGLAAAGLVALVALLVAVRAHARAARAEAGAAALAERVALLESPVASVPPPRADDATTGTYVITGVGTDVPVDRPPVDPTPVAAPIDGRLFTDIVARETVVKAASWSHGLRRALSPANRNRIRFEMRQETRRAGRERRAETRQALREFRARQRADLGGRPHVGGTGEDVA